MTYTALKKVLDPEYRYLTKAEFVALMRDPDTDQKSRVGGPKGKGRITAKRALSLLGIPGEVTW